MMKFDRETVRKHKATYYTYIYLDHWQKEYSKILKWKTCLGIHMFLGMWKKQTNRFSDFKLLRVLLVNLNITPKHSIEFITQFPEHFRKMKTYIFASLFYFILL